MKKIRAKYYIAYGSNLNLEQNPSRRESWSDEIKQTARERQLRIIERRRKDDSSD